MASGMPLLPCAILISSDFAGRSWSRMRALQHKASEANVLREKQINTQDRLLSMVVDVLAVFR